MNRHNAPPVVYPLGRSRILGRLLLAVWCAGLLATLCWIHGISQFDWRMGLAFLALLVTGLAVRRGWSRMPGGQLSWDGESWRWESTSYQTASTAQELSIIADFQHMVLLRLENQTGAGLWLWLERSAMPERWMDLRRAVYSPHRAPAAKQHDLLAEEASPFSPGSASGIVHPAKVPRVES